MNDTMNVILTALPVLFILILVLAWLDSDHRR